MTHKFLLLICLSFISFPSFSATTTQYSAEITVEPTKPSTNSWDIAGGAPDIFIKIKGALPQTNFCRDSYHCTVAFTSDNDSWYIEIYDRDINQNDLIGLGKCSVNKKCQLNSAVILITE